MGVIIGKRGAILAAVGVLKAINGAPFKTNLEGRVYTRLALPLDPEHQIVRPYVCLDVDQENESVEYEADGAGFVSTWRIPAYAFFDDNIESDPLDSSGALAAADFRDDLIESFLADQTLGGQTRNCEVSGFNTLPASTGDATTWLLFTIEFTQGGGVS